jgi:putative transposase
MAATVSPATGRYYGVARVCQVWDVPRSSFYAARQAAAAAGPAKPPARRGPKPAVSDDALLAAIKDDLARSPWTGEGHRKVLCGRPGFDNRLLSLAASSPGMPQGEPLHAPWP